jgi:hypothetical protein
MSKDQANEKIIYAKNLKSQVSTSMSSGTLFLGNPWQ